MSQVSRHHLLNYLPSPFCQRSGQANFGSTMRAIAQMKPISSRAIATTTLGAGLPAATSVAAVIVAEVGCFSRFDSPRQLMAYLGLNPSELMADIPARAVPTEQEAARFPLPERLEAFRFGQPSF